MGEMDTKLSLMINTYLWTGKIIMKEAENESQWMSGKILAVWCHGIEQKGYLIIKVEEITIINSFKVFSCGRGAESYSNSRRDFAQGKEFSFNIFSLFSLMGFLEHTLLMEQLFGKREKRGKGVFAGINLWEG